MSITFSKREVSQQSSEIYCRSRLILTVVTSRLSSRVANGRLSPGLDKLSNRGQVVRALTGRQVGVNALKNECSKALNMLGRFWGLA